MEESEVPTEGLQEDIHHHAEHPGERWFSGVALSTALMAGLAALASLLAGHHANEAVIEQVRASDQWAYYQAKGVKREVLNSKVELLAALGHKTEEQDRAKLDKYDRERDESRDTARELEQSSERHLHRHTILARGVTLFQIAIAVAAIAVLMRKRRFWYLSLLLGGLGVVFLTQGILA